MEYYIEYIEKSCEGLKDSPKLYKYKRQVLETLTERADELTSRGITDNRVIFDLISDEYPNLRDVFLGFLERDKAIKKAKYRVIGGFLFFALILISYFTVSGLTHRWDLSWLIIVGGIFALTIYGLSFAIKKLCKMSRLFQPIARFLMIISNMLITVFLFLTMLMFKVFPHAWTVLLGGVIFSMVADGIFAIITHQKFRIINYLLYIPAISALLYVILGAFSVVSWSLGWLIIIGGVVLDILIIIYEIVKNSKYIYKGEVDDSWNEN